MKIYTIATKTTECAGHGDYFEQQKIVRMGGYGQGDFPPVFSTYEAASLYRENNLKNRDRTVVVELNFQTE